MISSILISARLWSRKADLSFLFSELPERTNERTCLKTSEEGGESPRMTYMFGLGGTVGFTLNCLNETDLMDELHDPLESRQVGKRRQIRHQITNQPTGST